MRGSLNDRPRRMPFTKVAPAITAVALLFAALFAPSSFAAAPTPVLGSAVVDGDPGEWTAADYFADMTDNGDPDNDVLATLSLRYDCDTETLYALVMATSGNEGLVKQDRPDEAYLRIGTTKIVQASSGDDGTPPDFAWVNGDGTRADGYEASAALASGSHLLRAHFLLEFDDEDGYLTVDTVPREAPLTIECPTPTPTPSPTPTPTPAPTEDTNPTPTPTPTPVPTEGTNPTPTPTPTVRPTEGTNPTPTPTPQGNVGGATGTPNVTLPPTDTLPATGGSDAGSDGLRPAFLLLAAIMAALALLTPARTVQHARNRIRRR